MKKEYIIFTLILVLIASLILIFGMSKKTNEVLVVAATETPPFEYYEDGNLIGIDIEILNEVFKKLNISYEIVMDDWEKSLDLAQKGERDMILGAGYFVEREDFFYYTDEQKQFGRNSDVIPSDCLWVSQEVFFYKKGKNFDLSSYETIRENSYRVAVIKGYGYFPGLYEENLNFYSYPDVKSALIAVQAEEMDLVILDKLEGENNMKLINISDLTFSDWVLDQGGNYILFSKKSNYKNLEKIKNEFYSEMKVLKEEGFYDEVFKKYLGKSYSEIYF